MSVWVNFKELRRKLTFETVFRHYHVEIRRKGHQHQGFCPLPNHEGKKRSPSFSANLERGIFQCFGCGAKGNLLEFAALMEGVALEDGVGLRRVALKLQERFCPELRREPPKKSEAPEPETAKPNDNNSVVVNAPLDFELKGLDSAHPYLRSRGLTAGTVAHFGLGVATRGSLKDRLAIPLHGHDGKLLGYAGRVVDDAAITEDNPRYRFPGKRERLGVLHEFRKTLFLYNGFRVGSPVEDLIVVEGFTGVWWLHQHGRPHVVATMGAVCSARQAELIVSLVKPSGRVWVMPDGDAAGIRCAETILSQVASERFCRWMRLRESRQPTDLSAVELKAHLP